MQLSDATLARKLKYDEALRCLSDYRAAGAQITSSEHTRLSALLDCGLSPADAAEQVQIESNC